MPQRILMVALYLLAISTVALGRPAPKHTLPERIEGSTPWLIAPNTNLNKAAVDTVYLLGGPDRLDGSFETASGNPDWHGWTSYDLTEPTEFNWHVSDYWAFGLNGHGAGNQALVCVNEDLPACSENDTIGGVASTWSNAIEWVGTVANPLEPVTVRLTAFMHYDLADAGWDFLEFFIVRGTSEQMLEQWTGTDHNVALDFTTVLQPGDLVGANNDEVRFFWRVWSDGGWDDRDCLSPSHGAAQIDDISIYFNDELINFYDFESGVLTDWKKKEFAGVGNFAKLRGNLQDLDPCQQNTSIQVSFIDDGSVVPGTGGTYCQEWCYGTGGYILNNDGGLLSDDTFKDWFLLNEVRSAPIAWVPGNDSAELNFDVYVHETLCADCPGIFYRWGVRSTDSDDPADLELAAWEDRNFVHYGNPEYKRQIEPVGDLIVQDAKWVQIQLLVDEAGWVWGWNGANGTPAPYFDNVALKAWPAEGPQILVAVQNNFMDSFPEQGVPNTADLGSNWCRIDIASDIDYQDLSLDIGDSLVAEIEALRYGATLAGTPQMNWVMDCNPVFDSVRPAAPGAGGILRGTVQASEVYYGPTHYPNHWAFDLPDTGFFFPGDRLRYYITASDEIGIDLKTAVWPADTTSILDFTADSAYPEFAEVRALPTISMPAPMEFSQPGIVILDEAVAAGSQDRLLRSMTELGYLPGVDYDHVRIRGTQYWSPLGIGASATAATLDGYDTLIYNASTRGTPSLAGDNDTDDDLLFIDWLDLGGKNAVLTGDFLFNSISTYSPDLASRLGYFNHVRDISTVNGGSKDLRINPIPGNGILPDDDTWMVNGMCPIDRSIGAFYAGAGNFELASLDPAGQTAGPYSAVLAQADTLLNNRIAMLPFELMPVVTAPENPVTGAPNFSARTILLKHLLDWFGDSESGPYSPVPEARTLSLSAAPNPFNPRTTLAFELPHAAAVTLDIFDVQGRRIRQLIDEEMTAGPHAKVWNGRDANGRAVPSGIYFYRFAADQQERFGKLTLLK